VALGLAALTGGPACVGEGRPLEEYLEDYERIHPLPDGGRPDGGMASECSAFGEGSARLLFVNDYSNNTVRFFWVNQQCQEVLYGTLAPGEEQEQSTYGGHVWVVRDGRGTLVREYRAVAGTETFTVSVP
jgi:hypothetical protein